MYKVIVERKFSSAHFLRDYHGKDEPLHGHNWKVQIQFSGKNLIAPEEYLVDFVEVQESLKKVVSQIDYCNINERAPFDRINPSAENIARWICEQMAALHPECPPVCVTVWETDDGAASYSPQ